MGSIEEWRIEVSTGTFLSNLYDADSTRTYVIIIKKSKDDCAPTLWNAYKLKRTTELTLQAKCFTLIAGIKKAVWLREMVESVFALRDKCISVEA